MTERPRRIERVDDAMAEVLRHKTEEERLAIGFRMWVFARNFLRSTIQTEHPEWTEQEVNQAVARRLSHGRV